MKCKGKSDWIIDASGIPEEKYSKTLVTEDSLRDIETALNKIDFDDNDELASFICGLTIRRSAELKV